MMNFGKNTLSSTATLVAGLAVTMGAQTASAQITEGFDTLGTTLPPTNWVVQNNSAPGGLVSWFNGNPAVFAAQSGAGYIGVNFNSTSGTNTISNWLISPETSLAPGSTITFWTRTVTSPAFPDRLQVRLSLAGSGTNVGTQPEDVGTFGKLIIDINPTLTTAGYPNTWTNYTYTLTAADVAAPTQGRIAFRYYVTNGGPSGANSDYIGIDNFTYVSDDCQLPLPAGCIADITGDQSVGVADLLSVIGNWGASGVGAPPRPAQDIAPAPNGDCIVGVPDLLKVINSWGPCNGACCNAGSCTQATQSACTGAGGTYLGYGVACDQCPVSIAASDSCAGAPDVSAQINAGPILGSNVGFTPTPGVGNDPELPVGSPSCQWNTNPAATHSTGFYKVVAPANGSITARLCNSTGLTDSIMAIYSGSCGALVELACGEDDCGSSGYDSIASVTGLTPGTTYYILVAAPGDWAGSVEGAFQLELTSP